MSELTALEQIGVVCVLAAAIGGGLKLLGHEIRPIDSLARQLILAVIGLGLIGWGSFERGGFVRELFVPSAGKFCLLYTHSIRMTDGKTLVMPEAAKTCVFPSKSECEQARNPNTDRCIPSPQFVFCFATNDTDMCYISPGDCSSVARALGIETTCEAKAAMHATGE